MILSGITLTITMPSLMNFLLASRAFFLSVSVATLLLGDRSEIGWSSVVDLDTSNKMATYWDPFFWKVGQVFLIRTAYV